MLEIEELQQQACAWPRHRGVKGRDLMEHWNTRGEICSFGFGGFLGRSRHQLICLGTGEQGDPFFPCLPARLDFSKQHSAPSQVWSNLHQTPTPCAPQGHLCKCKSGSELGQQAFPQRTNTGPLHAQSLLNCHLQFWWK